MDVYNPRIPVILDREYNVVSEIVIPRTEAGQASGEVEVTLEGIPLKAVKDIRLVYIGTISPLMSRTKSNVMKSPLSRKRPLVTSTRGPCPAVRSFISPS